MGYRLQGNVFVSGEDRYLPLYEAKMLHQFDHRFSTYEGATQNQLNVGILPQPTAEQKRDPSFVVQPRYWVREEVVEGTVPRYPPQLASALDTGEMSCVKLELCLWCAGYYLERGNSDAAETMLRVAQLLHVPETLSGLLAGANFKTFAVDMQRDFPLSEADVRRIEREMDEPESVANELIKRFSPKWFLGWRDITNAGNERTMISARAPKWRSGTTFCCMFCGPVQRHPGGFDCMANALFRQDYVRATKGRRHPYKIFLPVTSFLYSPHTIFDRAPP